MFIQTCRALFMCVPVHRKTFYSLKQHDEHPPPRAEKRVEFASADAPVVGTFLSSFP